MRLSKSILCFALLFLGALPAGSKSRTAQHVEGVVVDIADSRIWNATVAFENEGHKYSTQTKQDGTYSIELKPGTYTVSVSSMGFCTLRRAAFVLEKHTTVQFSFQMWVCPTDMKFIEYAELEKVPGTQIEPLVLFGKRGTEGGVQRFSGPTTDNDGTLHPRKYPAVFTFNLLSVQAEELAYDPNIHMPTARGNVIWRAGSDSGAQISPQLRLQD